MSPRTATLEKIVSKIYPDRNELRSHLDRNYENRVTVFTNGCFDLLHRGHLTYLCQARDLGDLLIVAVNSDASVKKLKGPERPLNGELDRAFALASLSFVDFVTVFSEDTPAETLEILKPRIHTKGGDYRLEELPEKRVIDSYGGKIELIPFVDGYSTTDLIRKMGK